MGINWPTVLVVFVIAFVLLVALGIVTVEVNPRYFG